MTDQNNVNNPQPGDESASAYPAPTTAGQDGVVSGPAYPTTFTQDGSVSGPTYPTTTIPTIPQSQASTSTSPYQAPTQPPYPSDNQTAVLGAPGAYGDNAPTTAMPASPYQVKMPAQPQYPADQPTTALPPVSSTMPAAYPPQQGLPQGPQDPGNKKKLSPAAIVGIVAGALVLIALVVWGIVSITHRQDTPTASTTSTSQATPSPSDHSKDNGKDKDTDDLADELDEDLDDFSDLDDSNATRIPQGESLEEFLTSTGSLDMLRESIESQSNENASGTVRVQGDTLIIEFRLKTIRGDAAKEVAKADVFDDDDSIREQLESLHEYFPNAAIKVVVYDADGATVLERTYE